ncbi:unnamed protein product [Fraxinus pennsylvanica]|uniref:DOG1 domain-containing protein n=1 Tax=Fraxinus pennsylvanica TaxID=56036 RepID=A0AAD1YQQ4_9LAMI|nr:unnamed protein product [Fraxinus pennsylvanica]
MGSCDKKLEECLYQEWMSLREQELSELNHAIKLREQAQQNDAEMRRLVDKLMQHFEDYVEKRRYLAHKDVSAFFSPTWCTTFANSVCRVAGCRPSSYFSLVYALCGSEIVSKRVGDAKTSGFSLLSAFQLSSLDNLQRRTIGEEEKLSTQMATLPLALIAQKSGPKHESCPIVRDALKKINQAMVSSMEEADILRQNTVKEIISILKPMQALDFMASAKKLRQARGKESDNDHGRH